MLVNQSNEKNCEPHVFVEGEGMPGGNPWDTSGEMAGCVVIPRYLVLQASVERWSVLSRGMSTWDNVGIPLRSSDVLGWLQIG